MIEIGRIKGDEIHWLSVKEKWAASPLVPFVYPQVIPHRFYILWSQYEPWRSKWLYFVSVSDYVYLVCYWFNRSEQRSPERQRVHSEVRMDFLDYGFSGWCGGCISNSSGNGMTTAAKQYGCGITMRRTRSRHCLADTDLRRLASPILICYDSHLRVDCRLGYRGRYHAQSILW